jgi:hypothetical protein
MEERETLLKAAEQLRTPRYPSARTMTHTTAALLRAREPIARWLETEAVSNAGDEDHEHCTAETCTLIAALDVAKEILGEK